MLARKSRITRIPSVPNLKSISPEDQRELQRWMLAVTEHLQLADKDDLRGNLLDKHVTVDMMRKLGFNTDAFNALFPYGFDNNLFPISRWDDLRYPAGLADLPAAYPANRVLVTIDSVAYQVLQFEDEAVNEDRAQFIVQMPHAWEYGSAIEPHLHWMGEDTTAGNVAWQLSYCIAPVYGVFDTSTTETVVAANNEDSTYYHNLTEFSAIDMAGYDLSTIILFELRRNSTNASDTLTGKDALLLEFDIHFKRNKFGSLQEFTNVRK